MFGFVFGIACLYGLSRAVRGRGCAPYRWRMRHRFGHGHHRDYRSHASSLLWDVLDHLDTSPGQEKVIRAEIAKLFDQAHSAKRVWRRSGDDVARAIRTESFDPTTLAEAFSAQDSALAELRDAVTGALARIHEVLDARQREKLAEMFESGLMRGGPYRGWV
ncbi:MAG: hypothetical protein MJE77_20105 [Proteobacteria bacterium]|nr:hypothetical protein [Pseudomonadota bacterium]